VSKQPVRKGQDSEPENFRSFGFPDTEDLMKRYLLLCWLLIRLTASAQPGVNPALLQKTWPAAWIGLPGESGRSYGVYHFRHRLDLATVPARYPVHVTADNRYRLFVNGRAVRSGPARGDLNHWYFETVDLAPYLRTGPNVLAAVVWNAAEHAPVAQMSHSTAFLLQGDTEAEAAVNTGTRQGGWKVLKNDAYTPCSIDNGARLWTYMVVGPGDRVDAARYPWGWEQVAFDDSGWKPAARVKEAVPEGQGTDNFWTLVPRSIPPMEETPQRIPRLRRARGVTATDGLLTGTQPLTIPARTRVELLLDQTFETTGYPELTLSGGRGATVRLTYAEALFRDRKKGHRDEIEGREIMGNYDEFLPDGGARRTFRPLWLRTWRYLQLDIETGTEPLTLHDVTGTFTAYPFEEKARFASDDPQLTDIWKVGWRTARLCAAETYYDCPYYEQLQYVGDTRIQALISLYVSGDDRLMRKAINDFHLSRVSDGLTQSRYPANRYQLIPPFSLYWCSMLYDHWMHRRDDAFVRRYLMGIRNVLDWYERHVDADRAMLGAMPWWNFSDWNRAWPNGVPGGATDGHSAVVTLHFVYTLGQMAELFAGMGQPADAQRYRQLAQRLGAGTLRACYDARRGLVADTPDKRAFSQHASIMGVLSSAVPAAQHRPMMERVLSDDSLSQATFYYRFYLNQALKKAGMSQQYVGQLTPWRDMLAMGLTTFAENPEPTRSDCHAWSASPNYDLLATVCGIVPDAPGFARVRIAPALGTLQRVEAAMPHPAGEIEVRLVRTAVNGITADISLPPGVPGRFLWNGREVPLRAGRQQVKL
jgi:alpha-L-rhamnosidase